MLINLPPGTPPEIEAKINDRLGEIEIVEQRELYEEDLTEFVKGAWSSIDSSDYQESWAISAICDHLECVTSGDIKRLLINVSPRTGKTSIISIIYPVWVWARSQKSFLSGPQVKFLCASYNHALTLDSSTKSRRLISSPWFQKYWGNKIEFHSDANTKGAYANTLGGARFSTSVGGSLLGLGGDILISDDLNKVEKDQIESDAEREEVRDFWSEFHSTRLNDPKRSAIINVQQRLNAKDVSGIILDSDEDWIHLCLPMRYDESRHCVTVKLPQYDSEEPWEDPRKFTHVELMWPERFGEKEVSNLERELGPFMAAGRLQQMPVPKGGGILRRDWWQLWDKTEAQRYGLEWDSRPGGHKEYPEFDLVVGSIDTAYGQKEENDYNAMTVWGLWTDQNKNRKAMLVFAWNKRLPLHGRVLSVEPGEAGVNFRERQKAEWGLIETIADTCKRYKIRRLLVEDKTRGRDVVQEINRLYAREQWGCELVVPVRDKVTRAHSIVPIFTDGCVYAPNMRWADMVISQAEVFPKGDHDDLVDSSVQFLMWAREREILMRADEYEALMQDDQMYKPRSQSIGEAYGVG